jgi:hypothetical protein
MFNRMSAGTAELMAVVVLVVAACSSTGTGTTATSSAPATQAAPFVGRSVPERG